MEKQTNTQAAVEELLAQYRREAQGPGPLWAAAAKDIVRALEQKTPEEALTFLKKMIGYCGKMTLSCFYEHAVGTLETAIAKDRHLSKQN